MSLLCWNSSTEPNEERDVEDAEATGDSPGEGTVELATVDGVESAVKVRLNAAL